MTVTVSSDIMYHNSPKTLDDLHWVSSTKLAVGFISNSISFASHHNLLII